jgi:two-component system NtrC family sensor kinase
VLYSLRADRRYADMLEREVAAQTRTLMDSLSATGAAERNLRVVMEAVPDAITVLDRDGRTVDMNAAAANLVGLPREAVPGRSIFEFLEAEAVGVTRENLDAAFAGDVRRFEVPFVRADQTRGISSMLYAPVREAGRVIKVLALSRDVTDLRHAEAQLQQAEKLAAMGQLVSGVAHEINNPAAIISGFAQTMMLDEVKPEHGEMMQMIYDEATRIGRITQNLLAFARAGSKERTLVDVNDVVRRTFALRSYHLSTLNIVAQLDLTQTDPKVWGNSSELQQMLLNLMINAEQALMTVDTPRTLTLRTVGTDRDVTIACIDTGPGIAPDIRERIFDPFFTTKPEGVGTGLGLSICYGIVHDHGGRLTVESEPGEGATFAALLPRDPRTQRRVSLETRQVVEEVGPLAVLLVDDEAGLRKAVARFLNRRGLQCRAVGDGAEALEVLRFQDFDVIISDVRMAGMNGPELLERLRADRPDLVPRLIFSTGDTFASETAALLEESGVPYLLKPFDFARLETLIREVAARVST